MRAQVLLEYGISKTLRNESLQAKTKALDMKQSALLTNHGKRFMLRFHSYENILVASDDSDTFSIWDT